MADISTFTDLGGTTYNFKDSTARDSLVPSGGSDGQVLTRVGSQGAYAWQDPSGGGNVNTVNQISPDANKNVQTMVELTQAQYDALPASKNSDNVAYYITDGSFPEPTASTVSYDNTQSGMQATTVQGALDELNSKIVDISSSTTLGAGITGSFRAYKYGKIVMVGGYLYGSFTNYDAIISGLPNAIDSYQRYAAKGSNNKLISIYGLENGTILVDTADNELDFSIMYLTNE